MVEKRGFSWVKKVVVVNRRNDNYRKQGYVLKEKGDKWYIRFKTDSGWVDKIDLVVYPETVEKASKAKIKELQEYLDLYDYCISPMWLKKILLRPLSILYNYQVDILIGFFKVNADYLMEYIKVVSDDTSAD